MPSASLTSPRSAIEQRLIDARARLNASDIAGACALANGVVADVPENRDALYLLAVCQRYLAQYDEAFATLSQLEALAPTLGRLHQERGHCHRDRGAHAQSRTSYERAVALDAALPASWLALQTLYEATGDATQLQRAREHIAYLNSLPAVLVNAKSLLTEGDLYHAEQLCRHYLQQHGSHLEGMRLLADIASRLDVLDEAEFLLESVLSFAPLHHDARYEYALVLAKRQKFSQALEQSRLLLTAQPGNLRYEALYAAQCAGLGDHASAIAAYTRLMGAFPEDPGIALSLGHAERAHGAQTKAIEAYKHAAERRPDFGDAYWSLANLKTYRFKTSELEHMQALLDTSTTGLADRYHLAFALGKALEDHQAFDQSFACYALGNALKQSEVQYRADLMERDLTLQAQILTADFFKSRPASGASAPDPIFIVGLPRAGSTLLEQILASHSAVEGTMELPNIRVFAHQLDGRRTRETTPRYPQCLHELPAERLRTMGERYLTDTRVYRTQKPFFIDKMPNNFRHIGLIHLILPNAKIIDARRDALDCCFSNYKQLYAAGQDFSYGLDTVGAYYRHYVQLMSHWDAVLPGKVLRVQYEDVVNDLERSVRRLLEHCGLPFEQACVDFYTTQRSVRTASSEQVRQPLYRSGIGQWRPYEKHLGVLRAALDPVG